MAGCFGNDPIDRHLESQVNAHCDDSGELSDQYLDDLDSYLNGEKESSKLESDVCSILKDHEVILHDNRVGVCIDGKIRFFTAIDFEEITERITNGI
jgi:hypothetical protein